MPQDCICGRRHLPSAPGFRSAGVVPHVQGGTGWPLLPCFSYSSTYGKLDHALNMEQLLRDVASW